MISQRREPPLLRGERWTFWSAVDKNCLNPVYCCSHELLQRQIRQRETTSLQIEFVGADGKYSKQGYLDHASAGQGIKKRRALLKPTTHHPRLERRLFLTFSLVLLLCVVAPLYILILLLSSVDAPVDQRSLTHHLNSQCIRTGYLMTTLMG